MRDIAALLFGTHSAGARGARGARGGWDSPPVPTGDWCQTTPGEGTLEWLGLTVGPRGRTRRGYRPRTTRARTR
jgi:hypothetical protein